MISTGLLLTLLTYAPPAEAPATAEAAAEGNEAAADEATADEAAKATAEQPSSDDAAAPDKRPDPIPPMTAKPRAPVPPSASATPGAPVGNASAAPLPPPPPPVRDAKIRNGPWRGMGWFGLRFGVTGPLDSGARPPASSRVLALDWDIEFGFRITRWIGLGLGIQRTAHDAVVETVTDSAGVPFAAEYRGFLTAYDLAFARAYLPVAGRIQPWAEVGGGLAVVDPPIVIEPGAFLGGSVRGGLGVDFWVGKIVTIDVGARYRANIVAGSVGHTLRGQAGLGFHW